MLVWSIASGSVGVRNITKSVIEQLLHLPWRLSGECIGWARCAIYRRNATFLPHYAGRDTVLTAPRTVACQVVHPSQPAPAEDGR